MVREINQAVEQLVGNYIWNAIIIFIITFVAMSLIKYLGTLIFEFILIKTDVYGEGSDIY